MDQYIADNPTASIKRFYDQKELELTNKYWPEFESIDSGLMKKNKLVPNLSESISEQAFFSKSNLIIFENNAFD